MAVRLVLSIAGFYHDMTPLRTFDDKWVQGIIGVQIYGYIARYLLFG